ncbi:hypothetical protein cypCar_00037631 [Cyprinus carpio]|nr:hypothetical protein cypCar_00037631 [Cyprinus carpio]
MCMELHLCQLFHIRGSIDLLEIFGVVNENGIEIPPMPPVHPPLTFDYVLVGKFSEDENNHIFKKQRAFIESLKKKKLHVHKIGDEDEKVFYCIRAPQNIFETYRYLLKVSDACNWSCEQQGTIPQSIRNYLGEKVALYFLWLGWYTFLLIPASVIGVIVFLYGLAFYNTSPLIKEVCQSNVIMCPLCDKTCKVWELSETCMYAKVTLLFDNEGTVAFAMFMAVWATVFLEFWKRHRSSYVCAWKVFDWCEEEEELILEIVNNAQCEPKIHRHSYLRSTIVMVLVTLMLLIIIGLTHVLVVCRVIATVLLAENSPWKVITENSQTVAVMLGAVLHYITITVMTRSGLGFGISEHLSLFTYCMMTIVVTMYNYFMQVNCTVAMKLSEMENKHSHAAVERSFTVKMFIFQFFTMFSSLIYTAFFLGR